MNKLKRQVTVVPGIFITGTAERVDKSPVFDVKTRKLRPNGRRGNTQKSPACLKRGKMRQQFNFCKSHNSLKIQRGTARH
jgi:hypothetical protein